MRFALSLPNFGELADVRALCELAKDAEDHGWDGFFLWDHINWAPAPTLDPWVALAAVATATSRIRIGTMITPLPRRRPWKVAREAVTLDQLSGGRLVLGVGLGFPPDREYADLGEDADDRVRAQKLDESLEIITGLWSGEPFAHEGAHYRIARTTFLPRPVQQPRIPIWVAGMWPKKAPMRRAARFEGAFPLAQEADGDIRFLTVSEIRELRALVEAERGSLDGFDIVTGLLLPDDEGRARDAVAEMADAGLTWWVVSEFTRADVRARIRMKLPK